MTLLPRQRVGVGVPEEVLRVVHLLLHRWVQHGVLTSADHALILEEVGHRPLLLRLAWIPSLRVVVQLPPAEIIRKWLTRFYLHNIAQAWSIKFSPLVKTTNKTEQKKCINIRNCEIMSCGMVIMAKNNVAFLTVMSF